VPIIGLHGRIPGSDTPTKSQAARRAVAPRAVAFHHRLPRRLGHAAGTDRPLFPDADANANPDASGSGCVLVSGGPSRHLLSFRCAQTVGEHAQNSTASALR